MIAYGCLALASGIALARPRPFRPDAVPRQRPHRWRSRTCRARPLRSHRSPCSLTLAAAVTNVVNESDRVAITASPRASRWRASALGIGGRQGRAPLDQMKKVEGLASVRDRSSQTRQGRTFPSRGRSRPRPRPDLRPSRPCGRGRVALTRIRVPGPDEVLGQRPGRRRSAPCSGASRCSASPASPIAMLADARGDRTNAVNETDRAAITASPRASRWRASAPGIGGSTARHRGTRSPAPAERSRRQCRRRMRHGHRTAATTQPPRFLPGTFHRTPRVSVGASVDRHDRIRTRKRSPERIRLPTFLPDSADASEDDAAASAGRDDDASRSRAAPVPRRLTRQR